MSLFQGTDNLRMYEFQLSVVSDSCQFSKPAGEDIYNTAAAEDAEYSVVSKPQVVVFYVRSINNLKTDSEIYGTAEVPEDTVLLL